MLFTYYFISIHTIGKLATIHYQYNFLRNDPQHQLLLFSKERYDELVFGKKPNSYSLKYFAAKVATSKVGNFIFGNYSRYRYCGYLIDIKNLDPTTQIHQLPNCYQKLLHEIYY